MDIYINNEKIEFVLENEKNAMDIVNGVADFASKSATQQFITFISIDGQEFSFADEKKLSEIKLDKIQIMKIDTTDIFGISILSVSQIERFLILITDIIEGSAWDDSFKKICESMDWMKEGVNQIVSIFGNEQNVLLNNKISFYSAFDKLNNIFSDISPEKYPFSPEIKNQAIELKDLMFTIIGNIKNHINALGKTFDKEVVMNNIQTLLEEIDEILPKLANVPVLFQTGDDTEAMNIIKKLANILEKSISIFVIFKENSTLHLDKYTVREVGFEEFFNTLTGHLKELMTSIENKDSIMIGDLLEYEFVPNIEEIKNILAKIMQEAFVKVN